jgi:hypothetical protein
MRGDRAIAKHSLPSWAAPVAIAAACIIAYFPTLSISFLADDFVIMRNIDNGLIVETGTGGAFFRPLVWLTFSLNWFVFGYRPIWFHIFDLAIHFAASLGVAACASLMLRNRSAGLVAGLIFALHPAHPEAVIWISGRYDLITGALLVWSLYCYLRAREANAGHKKTLRITSYVLFGLACFSKELAFIFPFVILLFELMPIDGIRKAEKALKTRIIRTIPIFIIAAVIFILRWIRVGGVGGGEYVPGQTFDVFSLRTLYHVFIQPFKILFIPLSPPLFDPIGLVGIVILCGVLLLPLLLLLARTRWRVIAICAGGIIICMLPTAYMGIYEETLRNTRFLYTASAFFSILISALFFSGDLKDRMQRAVSIFMIVYILTLFLCLQQNNAPWREAGRLVRGAEHSAAELIAAHKGEWGASRNKLLAFNVPKTYIGALVFDWGLPEMLRLRHGDELEGVEIEVLFSPIQNPDDVRKIEHGEEEGFTVWYFDNYGGKFTEGNRIPSKK